MDIEKRSSEEHIICLLSEVEAGLPVKEPCRRHGFSEATCCLWRSKFLGMDAPQAERLKELGIARARLQKLLAGQVLGNEVIKEVLPENGERTGPTRAGVLPGRQGLGRAARLAGCRPRDFRIYASHPA